MQIKEMANFIMYVLLVEFVFSDTCSYMYFDLNLNAIILILHDEATYRIKIQFLSIVPWCLLQLSNRIHVVHSSTIRYTLQLYITPCLSSGRAAEHSLFIYIFFVTDII
jgi:hypothetical protein